MYTKILLLPTIILSVLTTLEFHHVVYLKGNKKIYHALAGDKVVVGQTYAIPVDGCSKIYSIDGR